MLGREDKVEEAQLPDLHAGVEAGIIVAVFDSSGVTWPEPGINGETCHPECVSEPRQPSTSRARRDVVAEVTSSWWHPGRTRAGVQHEGADPGPSTW